MKNRKKLRNINYPSWLIPALFIGFSVRMISIGQSLWMDESISAYAAKSFSFTGIISNFIISDTHPPLYYLILKAWSAVFGYSDVALRLPSVIFGTLTVYLIFRISRLWSNKASFFATWLTVFSPLLIYYSQEARMYSLSTFLVTLCFFSFFEKRKILFSIGLLLLGMTDYYPLIILLSIWIIFLTGKNKRENIWFITAQIPLAAFLVIWFPVLRVQSSESMKFVSTMPEFAKILGVASLKNLILVWVKFLIGRISFGSKYIYAAVLIAVSLLYSFPFFTALKEIKNTSRLWLWFTVPVAISFVFAFRIPGFSYFRLLFCLPALILLISYGLTRFNSGNRIFTVILASELIFSSIYLFNRNFWREDWKNAVPFIEKRIKPGEKVLIAYKESFTPYEWYARKKDNVESFYNVSSPEYQAFYSLDYLMDLTDPERNYYKNMEIKGYKNTEVYNFRGIGQVRYWVKQ